MIHAFEMNELLKYRPTFHRWFYLGVAILYLIVSFDTLAFALSESSFGVPYVVVVVVPPTVLVLHCILSRLISWWVVVLTFLTMFLHQASSGLYIAWGWIEGGKWQWSQGVLVLLMNMALLGVGLGVLYLTRPRRDRSVGAA